MIQRFAAPVALVALLALLSATPVRADARSEARALVAFGIEVSSRGLWREAIYRWEKAAELDPTYAAAFNNLGVGYEHEGQMDKALQAYERAMTLAPKDTQIRQNFELFKEIHERTVAKETP